jgi:hypothetical protein
MTDFVQRRAVVSSFGSSPPPPRRAAPAFFVIGLEAVARDDGFTSAHRQNLVGINGDIRQPRRARGFHERFQEASPSAHRFVDTLRSLTRTIPDMSTISHPTKSLLWTVVAKPENRQTVKAKSDGTLCTLLLAPRPGLDHPGFGHNRCSSDGLNKTF